MSKLTAWLTLLILTTALIGLIYVTGQQILRQDANDPQIQISEDMAHLLASGKSLPSSTFATSVDIATSLSTYMIVYNDKGTAIGSTGLLDGTIPTLPAGVLSYTKEQGQDRITWQPKPGVRSAVVITHVPEGLGGYVLVGRSLREVEKREDKITFFAGSVWIASMIAIGMGFALTSDKRTKQ